MMATGQVNRRQLFVGNLPFSVGWQELKDLFRGSGNVVRADVAMTPQGRSRGFGTVLFETEEEAQNAVAQFNNYELLGRKIEVREDRAASSAGASSAPNESSRAVAEGDGSAVSRGLYVGNLPYAVGWQDLKDLFRAAGNVQRADIPQDYQGRSKGFGTVTMGSVEEARKAVALLNGHEWNGRRIEVREDRNFVEGGQADNTSGSTHASQGGIVGSNGGSTAGRALFVGNLPFNVQWQELKDLFRQAGNVQRADVVQDATGRSRGYGQVQMSTVEEAQKAIQLFNGHDLQGRAIEVREDKFAANGGAGNAASQVFVGNLPYSTRWQELKDIFRPYGLNPIHADILIDQASGRSKGCGIVRFGTKEESERAVEEVNGLNVAGRAVVVRLDKFV
ncbi:hypothetical protein BJ742DRAFT_794725 [Cladochytrium replicatum]|nr:hypothetical protein BJ742DRAFT_794725 [Cladochytrium replicatum]